MRPSVFLLFSRWVACFLWVRNAYTRAPLLHPRLPAHHPPYGRCFHFLVASPRPSCWLLNWFGFCDLKQRVPMLSICRSEIYGVKVYCFVLIFEIIRLASLLIDVYTVWAFYWLLHILGWSFVLRNGVAWRKSGQSNNLWWLKTIFEDLTTAFAGETLILFSKTEINMSCVIKYLKYRHFCALTS